MPAARMAVISPSLDMRLSVISVPTSTPSGIVKGSACGSTNANRYAVNDDDPELRTRNSNSGPCAIQEQHEREQHRTQKRADENLAKYGAA
jgi:hypothetical protein